MKIIKEATNLENSKWTDEAEKMLRYYTTGSIDNNLEKETNGRYDKYDMEQMEITLKNAKSAAMRDWGGDRKDPEVLAQVKKNRELYDDRVHFLDKGEYERLKSMFIDKYDTPVPKYNVITGKLDDNGASHYEKPLKRENMKIEKITEAKKYMKIEKVNESFGWPEDPRDEVKDADRKEMQDAIAKYIVKNDMNTSPMAILDMFPDNAIEQVYKNYLMMGESLDEASDRVKATGDRLAAKYNKPMQKKDFVNAFIYAYKRDKDLAKLIKCFRWEELSYALDQYCNYDEDSKMELLNKGKEFSESLDKVHEELSHSDTKAYTAKELGNALLSLKGKGANYPVYINDSEWGDEEVNDFFVDEDEKRVYIRY